MYYVLEVHAKFFSRYSLYIPFKRHTRFFERKHWFAKQKLWISLLPLQSACIDLSSICWTCPSLVLHWCHYYCIHNILYNNGPSMIKALLHWFQLVTSFLLLRFITNFFVLVHLRRWIRLRCISDKELNLRIKFV